MSNSPVIHTLTAHRPTALTTIAVALCGLLFSSSCWADQRYVASVSRWVFSADFTQAEQREVKEWISQVHTGLTRLLGPSPNPYELHFKKYSSRSSPVPWARTAKGWPMRVNFYVDMSYSPEQFRADWTAAHELSHMLFPYVGRDRWFSEGLASYLQNQVMYAAGHISWEEVMARYAERFARVKRSRVPPEWSVLEHNDRLREHGDYPRLYWGGAAYFGLVDKALWQTQRMRFVDVVRQYTVCCYRRGGVNAMDMIKTFDQISESRVFSQIYRASMMTEGPPETTELLRWLDQHPPGLIEDQVIPDAASYSATRLRTSGISDSPYSMASFNGSYPRISSEVAPSL